MQPLDQLLSRIKWDAEFGKGAFAVGYFDRVARQELVVPFEATSTDPARPHTLTLRDENGLVVHVPLHRVRTVYKDGVVIWQRPRR